MHSKLQLLAYPSHLRVVVPSANLTKYDWGETGVMENVSQNSEATSGLTEYVQTCFVIDLPRLPVEVDAEELTDFGEDLTRFLHAQGLEKRVVDSLKKFDFSETRRYAFVHSM